MYLSTKMVQKILFAFSSVSLRKTRSSIVWTKYKYIGKITHWRTYVQCGKNDKIHTISHFVMINNKCIDLYSFGMYIPLKVEFTSFCKTIFCNLFIIINMSDQHWKWSKIKIKRCYEILNKSKDCMVFQMKFININNYCHITSSCC